MQTVTPTAEVPSPDVSVIIPCYNYGHFLDDAIQSVLAQSWPSIEIVVVDDGSTDPATLALFEHFERPRTRLLRKPNGGPASARNLAIQHARGELILALDADDRIAPTFIEQAVQLMREDDSLGIVYGRIEFFGDRTGPWKMPDFRMPDMLFDNLIPSCGVFRRQDWERVGGYDTELPATEDYDFWLSLIELGRGVHRIDETMSYYRLHGSPRWLLDPESRWKTFRRIFERHRGMYLKHADGWFERYVALMIAHADAQMEVHHLRGQLEQQKMRLEALQRPEPDFTVESSSG